MGLISRGDSIKEKN